MFCAILEYKCICYTYKLYVLCMYSAEIRPKTFGKYDLYVIFKNIKYMCVEVLYEYNPQSFVKNLCKKALNI